MLVRRVRDILCWIIFCVLSSTAATVTGVILSNHSGQTAGASGEIKLVVANKHYLLYYDHSLQTQFTTDACWRIGMVWTVEYRTLQDSTLYAERATCDGKVNEAMHDAWLVVAEYLSGTDARPSARPNLFSSRWISSASGEKYEHDAVQLDLTDYRGYGRSGTCIDVTGVQSRAIHLEAGGDCHVVLSNLPVDLIVTVIQSDKGKHLEIDSIEVR